MKKYFLLLVQSCLFSATTIYAQEFKIDLRIRDALPNDYLESLITNNFDQVLFLQYFLDNGWYIDYIPTEKLLEIKSLKSIENIDNLSESELTQLLSDKKRRSEFNILKYKVERKLNGETLYKINDNGMVLIIYDNDKIMKGFNQYRNQFIN